MSAPPATVSSPAIRSLIPARIDRLPWSRFHTRMVMVLGVAWILDGLEITIASNVGPDLTLKGTLHMSASAVADIATPASRKRFRLAGLARSRLIGGARAERRAPPGHSARAARGPAGVTDP